MSFKATNTIVCTAMLSMPIVALFCGYQAQKRNVLAADQRAAEYSDLLDAEVGFLRNNLHTNSYTKMDGDLKPVVGCCCDKSGVWVSQIFIYSSSGVEVLTHTGAVAEVIFERYTRMEVSDE